ncbi:MAG: DUF6531 domain-containing protein [Nitrospirota bacterium]
MKNERVSNADKVILTLASVICSIALIPAHAYTISELPPHYTTSMILNDTGLQKVSTAGLKVADGAWVAKSMLGLAGDGLDLNVALTSCDPSRNLIDANKLNLQATAMPIPQGFGFVDLGGGNAEITSYFKLYMSCGSNRRYEPDPPQNPCIFGVNLASGAYESGTIVVSRQVLGEKLCGGYPELEVINYKMYCRYHNRPSTTPNITILTTTLTESTSQEQQNVIDLTQKISQALEQTDSSSTWHTARTKLQEAKSILENCISMQESVDYTIAEGASTDLGCSLNNTPVGSSANLKSGNLYHSQEVGGLTLSYNSLDTYKGPLGKGWTHNYNLHITSSAGDLVLKREDGNNVYFKLSNGIYYPDNKNGDTSSIVKNQDGTYTRTLKNGTVHTFDSSSKLSSIRDINGNTTTLTYNGNDLIGITDSSGRTISIANTNGRIISITDISGKVSTIAYTGDFLIDIADSTDASWSYIYDASGRLQTKTDPLGNTTTYTYAADGKLIASIDPEGKVKSIVYNVTSSTAQVTERDGGVWLHRYDSTLNVPLEVTDPQGNATRYSYDAKGNLMSKAEPDGSTTSYSYDERGNVTSVTDPLGNTTSYTYNELNRVTSSTDPHGNTTAYTYDVKGNLASVNRSGWSGHAVPV